MNTASLHHRRRRLLRACVARIAAALSVLAHSATMASTGTWTQEQGRGYSLCDGLSAALKRYDYPDPLQGPNACSTAVVANFPGLQEPAWRSVPPEREREILFEIYKLWNIGPEAYFGGAQGRRGAAWQRSVSELASEAAAFFERGGSLQTWQTPLPSRYSLLKKRPQTAGPLTFLNIRMPVNDGRSGLAGCRGAPRIDAASQVVLVTQDLTRPDPRPYTIEGAPLLIFNGLSLWFYRGVLHGIISTEAGVDVFRPDLPQASGGQEFCRLRYRH